MTKPIIFGAAGFIGQHLIQKIGFEECLPVSRRPPTDPRWVKANLLDRHSIESILKPGMTVINLAYATHASPDENIQMAKNLVQACQTVPISTLIHCSTAVVVGKNTAYCVDEETECFPETPYEKTKHEIEKIFLSATNQHVRVHVLRPTGVIGPHGKNLKKMLLEIKDGNPVINFMRSCLYGTRPLNLVSVNDVTEALLHLSAQPSLPSGVYICAADEDVHNQYHQIESLIRASLKKPARIKPIFLPAFMLNLLLRHRKGCGRNPRRYYSSKKLLASGFSPTTTLAEAVKEFVLSELTP